MVQRRLQNDILVVQIPCRVHDVDQRCAARVVHHVEIVTLRYAAFRAVGGGDLQKRSALRRARVQLLAEIAEGVVLHVLLVQPAETAEIDAEIPLFGIRIHKGDARRVLSVRRDGDRTVVFADERAVRLYLVRFAAVKDRPSALLRALLRRIRRAALVRNERKLHKIHRAARAVRIGHRQRDLIIIDRFPVVIGMFCEHAHLLAAEEHAFDRPVVTDELNAADARTDERERDVERARVPQHRIRAEGNRP